MAAKKKTEEELLHLDPDEIVIAGLDEDDENVLNDTDRTMKPLREEFIRNVMLMGILQPVRVRRDGPRYVAVAGRGRIRAAREANKRFVEAGSPKMKVPALLERGDDGHCVGVMIAENELRSNDGPMTKARKLKRLLDLGKSMEEAALVFGVQVQTLEIWKPLLDLDEKVQEAIDAGQISANAASPLAALKRADQRAKIEEIIESGGRVTARATRAAAASSNGQEVKAAPPKRQVMRMLALPKAKFEEAEIDAEFVRGVKWAIGELATKSVPNLTALIEEADARDREKKAKAKAAEGGKKKGRKGRLPPPKRGKATATA